jgi:hypothetical protein
MLLLVYNRPVICRLPLLATDEITTDQAQPPPKDIDRSYHIIAAEKLYPVFVAILQPQVLGKETCSKRWRGKFALVPHEPDN